MTRPASGRKDFKNGAIAVNDVCGADPFWRRTPMIDRGLRCPTDGVVQDNQVFVLACGNVLIRLEPEFCGNLQGQAPRKK
jgi:hypothetical protein